MSLRLRLTLAFSAMALVPAGVGLASYVVGHRLQQQVADLGSSHGVDLLHTDLADVCLEFEGFWDPTGSFFATDVEVVLGSHRPRLRGAIQAVDRAARLVTLFGVPILFDERTELEGAEEDDTGPVSILEDLRPGDRLEVTCDVVEGQWLARKVATRGVKESDKIKGIVTAKDLDGVAPETVELHGLLVSLAPSTDVAPESSLRRLSLATRMTLSIEECRAAAHALARGEGVDGAGDDAATRLERTRDDFVWCVREAPATGGASAGVEPTPSDVTARWIHPLTEELPRFEASVARMLDATSGSGAPAETREALQQLDAFLERDLLPRVYAYLSQTEEELGDRVRAIAAGAGTTTRLVLWTGAGAMLLALWLGVVLWRSINRPIEALHRAALRLGAGDRDTRVDVTSRDEIGDLARAFNRMADEIDRTTVSVAEKEMLLREVHHRVKNNMQVVCSLLAMQAAQSGDDATRARLGQSQDRIRSMALIHEQLYRSDDLSGIDSRAYIEMLTDHLRRSFGDARAIGIELEVEDVEIDVDQSLSCGLIINELVTNAFKHAFGEREGGTVAVSLGDDGSGRRVLTVADDGRGVDDPGRIAGAGSLGMSLVTMLARQLGGDVSVQGGHGTVVRVVFPARRVEAVA